jgi:hypothetical protein
MRSNLGYTHEVRCVGGILRVEKKGACSVAPFEAKTSLALLIQIGLA